MRRLTRHSISRRPGFSLVEAIISIGLMMMMGAILLSSTQVAVNATVESTDKAIAQGIACQIADEAMGLPYVAKSFTTADPNNVLVALGSGANSGARVSWDDIDDFNGANSTSTYRQTPVCDRWGQTLTFGDSASRGRASDLRLDDFRAAADFFNTWRVESNVYYLNSANLANRLSSGTSYFRALEVRVYRVHPNGAAVLLAQVRRVHSHVPK